MRFNKLLGLGGSLLLIAALFSAGAGPAAADGPDDGAGDDGGAAVTATGSLAAAAACNGDGSATVTWTLTNNFNRLMWVTWSANGYMPRDATTRTDPHSSKTFTQAIAAPAAGKTVRETIKLAWMDGSAQTGVTASVTIASDCVTPPPPPPPPPSPSVTFTHSEVCGQVTLGVASNETVGSNWYYGLEATVDGAVIGSVLQMGPGSNSTVLTLPEDSNGGSATVRVYVHAATEWDIISPAELNYQATYPDPVDSVWLITVNTDCAPPGICDRADVDWRHGTDDVSWEIHLGRQIADRNSPATYIPADHGGIVSITGFDDDLGNGDNIYVHYPEDVGATNTYTFGDGSTLVATVVAGTDCAPTIDWAFTSAPTMAVCGSFTNGGVSTNLDLNGWTFGETRTAGSNEYVAGGLKVTTTASAGGNAQSKAAGYHALNIPFADLGEPSMTYVDASGVLPSMQIGVDKDGNGTWDGYLVGEPASYGAGNWWSSKEFGVGAGMGYASFGTLQDYLTANPSARVLTIGYSLGSGVLGQATITSLTFGCTNFTFDLQQAPVVVMTTATATYIDHTCTVLGTMTLIGDHVTWILVTENATAAGPGGTLITGVPSGTWPALLDGASPISLTNTPYYGGVTVTAAPAPGYALAAPYSEHFTAHVPTDCPELTGFSTFGLPFDDDSDDPDTGSGGSTPPTTGSIAPTDSGSSRIPALAETGSNVDGSWLLIASVLLILGGATRGLHSRLGRRLQAGAGD